MRHLRTVFFAAALTGLAACADGPYGPIQPNAQQAPPPVGSQRMNPSTTPMDIGAAEPLAPPPLADGSF